MGILDKIQESKRFNRQKPTDTLQLFNSLSHKDGHENLRTVQSNFLEEWEKKREEKDIVGIMPTGAGKTLIGLLTLLSKMNESKEPSLYLCPNNQLVEQVIEQASYNDIPVVKFESGNNSLPSKFVNSEAILVTTFEKVFNGKSVFGVFGAGTRPVENVGSVVIDDAHACIKKARQQSTFTIQRKELPEFFDEFLNLFSDELERQAYSHYREIRNGDATISKLVPYWTWRNKLSEVRNLINELYERDDPSVIFAYNLLVDSLEKAQCFISGGSIEITPLRIPYEKIPSLNDAKHRLFLSASFGNNNYELIRELGVKKEAVNNPIEVESLSNIGEKMILAPENYYKEIYEDTVRSMVSDISEEHNVVVIVPSNIRARLWENYGATIVNESSEIIDAIKNLKESTGNLLVLINRYDGIDFPSDSSNILVLDGLPIGSSLKEKAQYLTRPQSKQFISHRAQEVEQGLGRTVRSGSDYSVVMLIGRSLLDFVGRKDNIAHFTKYTQGQLSLSLELLEDLNFENKSQAIVELETSINLCLNRDQGWINMYKQHMQDYKGVNITNNSLLELAENELKAFNEYERNKYVDAKSEIDFILNNSEKYNLTTEDLGWYFQLAAELLYQENYVQSNDLQQIAYGHNPTLLQPFTLKEWKKDKVDNDRNQETLKYLNSFTSKRDIIRTIQDIIDNLVYQTDFDNDSFEEAIKQLGILLGFESSRPEKEFGNSGPDNMWRSISTDIVIECKNNAEETISKDNLGQISQAESWYKESYKNSYNLVMFHPANKISRYAAMEDSVRVVTKEKLDSLIKALREYQEKIRDMDKSQINEDFIKLVNVEYHFGTKSFINYYTVPLKK